MTCGNAGGTDILVDGVITPALRAAGMVRRDLPLDANQISQGTPAVTGAHTSRQ